MILIAIVLAIFAAWRLSGDSLNVTRVQTFRGDVLLDGDSVFQHHGHSAG